MRGSKYNFIPSSIARTYCFSQKHYIMTTLLHEFTEIEMSDRMESKESPTFQRRRLRARAFTSTGWDTESAYVQHNVRAHVHTEPKTESSPIYFLERIGVNDIRGLAMCGRCSIYTKEHAYGNHTVPRKIRFYYFCWFSLKVGPNSPPAPSGVLLASSPYLAVNRRLSPAAG